ncbi:MAG: protein kinase [Anaerolineae bacterium]|nr:protein kinase [Anaerolineae bacterium]
MTTPHKTIRGYELRDQIGKGGFGAVYRAYQPIVAREVAIKVILPQFANQPDFIRSFESEAQMVARLEHPFIVPLFDYWRDPDGAYLVMRFLTGGSWRGMLKDHGKLAPAPLAQMLLQIAAALDAAHRQRVIHRDIKPENVLLDAEGNAYLADFGIAEQLKPDDNTTDDLRGTIAYVAPEILQFSQISPQSDIYSLGYTVHELLAGQHILWGQSINEMLAWHLENLLPTLDDLSPEVNRVIARATEKDPAERYPTAQAMAKAFFEAVYQQPIAIGTSTPFEVIRNPYKGLRPFDESDASDFFGRETIITQIVRHFQEERFLAVVGPSGSGKSSVVRAGVIPQIRKGAGYVITMMPSARPLEQLKNALLSVAVDPSDTLTGLLSARKDGLQAALSDVLDIRAPILLVIDQFEEVFTLVNDESERAHFLDLLYQAVRHPQGQLSLLITLRADFYDRPLLYEHFGSLVQQHTQVVLPLKSEELQQAIIQPAKRNGIVFEEALIAAIVSDVRQEPGALPLLQYALTELFNQRVGNLITLSAYQKSGGVSGALARRAEEIFRELNTSQQRIAQQIFLRLINLGEGTEDTRRRARYSELIALDEDRKEVQSVLDQFGKARLLTFDHDLETREPTIEVAHEALIREWRRLRAWINESRTDLRLQRMLANLMQEWRNAKGDPSFLLSGTRLAQFEDWIGSAHLTLSPDERAFLETSIQEKQRRAQVESERQARELALERRARLGLQAIVGILVIAAISGAFLVVQLYREGQNAQRRADESNSLRLAAQAQQAFIEGESTEAIRLALESVGIADPPQEALETLVEVSYAPGLRQRINTGEQALNAVAIAPDRRYAVIGTATDETPGTRNAPNPNNPPGQPAAPETYTLSVWDLSTGAPHLTLMQNHPTEYSDALFMPGDATHAVTASLDGMVIVWDVITGDRLAEFAFGEQDQISLAATDSYLLVVSGQNEGGLGEQIVIDPVTWQEIARYPAALPNVWTIAINSRGDLAISGYLDGTLISWNPQTGAEIARFQLQGPPIRPQSYHLAIAPDDETLAVVIGTSQTWLWNARTGTLLNRIPAGTVVTQRVAFIGDQLLIVAQDGKLRLWDVVNSAVIRDLVDRGVGVVDLAVNGDQVMIGTNHGLLDLWDTAETPVRVVQRYEGHVTKRAVFTDDGRHLLTFGRENNATRLVLWEVATGEVMRVFEGRGHDFIPQTLALSADGRTVLTGAVTRAPGAPPARPGQTNPLIVWDLQTGQEIRRLPFEHEALAIAFHPTQAPIVLVSAREVIQQWDVQTAQIIAEFRGHQRPVKALRWSSDGTRVISADDQGVLIVWDAATNAILNRIESGGQQGFLCLTPDDRYAILQAGDDPFALIQRDLTTGAEIRRFTGHSDRLLSCAISTDGRLLASGGWDNTFLLWDLTTGALIRRYTEHNAAIWDLHFNDSGLLSVGEGAGAILWRATPITLTEITDWLGRNRFLGGR